MNIQKIEQYSEIRKEIKLLEIRILELQMKEDIVSDTVSGSSLYFPYTVRRVTIEGVDAANNMKISKLRARLIERKLKLYTELEEIEEFIDSLNDSEIRQIIQLKYLDGSSWNVVARKIYGYPCQDRARKKFTRFFKKI